VGLKALERYDEPTLILFPDAPLLATDAELYSLQQQALAQAATLQDRFAVLDLKETADWGQAVQKFRDNIGINNLKYGAAYTPWLYSAYPKSVDFALFRGSVRDKANNLLDLATLTSDPNLNGLVTAAGAALDDRAALKAKVDALRTTSFPTLRDRYAKLRNDLNAATDAAAPGALDALLDYARAVAVDLVTWKAALKGANLRRDIDAYGKDKARKAAEDLIALEKNDSVRAASVPARTEANVTTDYAGFDATGWLSMAVNLIAKSATDYTNGGARGAHATALVVAADVDAAFAGLEGFAGDLLAAAKTHAEMAQGTLYQGHSIIGNMVEHVKRELAEVPPSGAVVGVYAYVDSTRGVWKAPANVSLSSVLGPVEQIDFFEQEDLNVDVTGGKSINAIRTFTGLGTLVWGARTLAGNDNEWRYVPVRRFFNMVEESVKKSTSWAVFEPNDAPLWTKVKSMIDNYLVQKWRDGALAGATPEQAFFVKVGLGQTMTAQDILEGRLIVEIGMAVVRPAEFIILRFSHKMQEA
jgi:phage tail sheath protein FI